jgi:endonuclease/exonuclease/phosphatase family metal-dependent hydrolase
MRWAPTSASSPPAPSPADALSIDHLACSQELSCTAVTGIRPRDDEGRIMSDHFGLRLVLRRQASR